MLFTPGPTAVAPPVREAMAEPQPNPDIEPAFESRYEDVCDKLATVYGTDHQVVVLGGEGILGLEAAVASLVEPGDRVLCISNGQYGDGFADFVEAYGGHPELISSPYDAGLDLPAVATALEAAAETGELFSMATMVHCETPTGTVNDLEPVLDLLEDYQVLTVVDAVSSLGGVPVPTDRIDVCLGGSQKCFSAPPGLTTAAISDRAWESMEACEPTSLYTNFLPWRDTSEEFPYTHLSANVAALDVALDLLLDEGLDSVYERHRKAADRAREGGAELNLTLYPEPTRASPTVTAFARPGDATTVQRRLHDETGILVATGLWDLEEDILRLGHMGYNADLDKVDRVIDGLAAVLD